MVHEKEIQAGVARVFNDAAGYYKEMRWERNRLAQFEKWLTQTTVEQELGDARVAKALELGCGPGTWTGILADRAEKVLAVDLSEAMLGQAAQTLAQRSNIELKQADIGSWRPDVRQDLERARPRVRARVAARCRVFWSVALTGRAGGRGDQDSDLGLAGHRKGTMVWASYVGSPADRAKPESRLLAALHPGAGYGPRFPGCGPG
jgi:SAM-dependent methyltransferase